MAKYILTNKSLEDLNTIWEYTFNQWSEEQADKYYLELVDTFQTIANSPSIGRKYTDIYNGLYGLPVNKHIIFYRKLDNNTIEITRILLGIMDIKSKFIS